MFLRELVRAVLRLWYVMLLGVILAGYAGYYQWSNTPPSYSSEASILLLPPSNETDGTAFDGSDSNPLLYLGGLTQARDLLISTMSSSTEQEKFEEQFADTDFIVGLHPLASGPIVVVTAESTDAETTDDAVNYLLTAVPERLQQIQGDLDIPSTATITSIPLTQPSTPEADSTPQLRAAAITGAGALVITVLLIAVIDGLLRNLRRSKTKEPAAKKKRRGARKTSAVDASEAETEASPDAETDADTDVDTRTEVDTEVEAEDTAERDADQSEVVDEDADNLQLNSKQG